jgi:hypothetical protein
VVKKEREQKSLRTNARREQELTDIRKSKNNLLFLVVFATKRSLKLKFINTLLNSQIIA